VYFFNTSIKGTSLHTIKPYAEISLSGNHCVRIYDHSSVYFGDYFRVRLEVRCEIQLPVKPENSGNGNCQPPEVAVYSRFLERMAVPSAEVEDVRLALIAEFRRNSLPYLVAPDFPEKLIARSLLQQTAVKKRYAAGNG
jgi:hypothetical protein